MIPQPFVRGAGERVFFGPFEYPSGADIIFDFGNPICTSEFTSSRIVYNLGSANITGSLMPGIGTVYPTLLSNYGGCVKFTAPTETAPISDANYIQWDWKSTQEQTNVFIYKPSNADDNSGEVGFPPQGSGANSLYVKINGLQDVYAGAYDSSNTQYDDLFNGPNLDTGSLNGRDGWNTIGFTANATSTQQFYLNQNAPLINNTTITRTTSGTQTFKFGNRATAGNTFDSIIMAYLQYPKILTPKQIRQIYKVFAVRFSQP